MDFVKDSYNAVAETWNDVRNKMPINKCIEDFALLLKDGASVLDIGCGTGYPIDCFLVSRGFFVTGIDISENMLIKAKERNLSSATFESADFLTFETEKKFDAVIAFDSLWHIARAEQEGIFKKLSSLLNGGGYLLFTYGKTDGEVYGDMFGKTFYYSSIDLAVTKRLLKENGFDILTCAENYKEATTGTRDLLIVAKKK